MESERWKTWAAMLICAILGGGIAFFALRLLLPVALPFLVGWLLARAVRKPAQRVGAVLRLPSRGVAVVLMLGLLTLLALLVGFGSRRLVLELKYFLERLLEENGGFYGAVENGLALLRERLISLVGGRDRGEGELQRQLQDMLIRVAGDILTSLSTYLSTLAGRLLSVLPTVLLVGVITVVSGVYFCLDGTAFGERIRALLPQELMERLPGWRRGGKPCASPIFACLPAVVFYHPGGAFTGVFRPGCSLSAAACHRDRPGGFASRAGHWSGFGAVGGGAIAAKAGRLGMRIVAFVRCYADPAADPGASTAGKKPWGASPFGVVCRLCRAAYIWHFRHDAGTSGCCRVEGAASRKRRGAKRENGGVSRSVFSHLKKTVAKWEKVWYNVSTS